jgi:hypothetical protein
MPSSSIDNCAGVSTTDPFFACGHRNRPRSNRLANRQALSVPPQHLQEIAAPTAKDEQRAAMWVELQHRLHPRRQTIEALPHVGDAARQVDTHIAGNTDHDSADNTCRNAAASTAPVSRSFTPEGSSTSIAPMAGRSTVGLAGAGSTSAVIEASCPIGGEATVTGANPVSSPVRNCRRQV